MSDRRHQLHGLRRAGASAILAAALIVGTTASPVPAVAATPAGSVQLSDEVGLTRWAYAAQVMPIRSHPVPEADLVAPVSLTTEDGRPEVYVLLSSWTDATGRKWLQVRVPLSPVATTGWVDAAALGRAHLTRTRLVIDLRRLRATLDRAGRVIWRSRIGAGKASTPTPTGRYWIRERLRSANPGGSYGPWAFGTSAYSSLSDWPGGGVIGIHGTDQPGLIPGRPSHGCIRIPNPEIRRLARLMPIGTPVWIM